MPGQRPSSIVGAVRASSTTSSATRPCPRRAGSSASSLADAGISGNQDAEYVHEHTMHHGTVSAKRQAGTGAAVDIITSSTSLLLILKSSLEIFRSSIVTPFKGSIFPPRTWYNPLYVSNFQRLLYLSRSFDYTYYIFISLFHFHIFRIFPFQSGFHISDNVLYYCMHPLL